MSINELELRQSGYIHFPLPLHPENSLETEMLRWEIQKEHSFRSLNTLSNWKKIGDVTLSLSLEQTPSDKPGIIFSAASPCCERPKGRLEEGDCSNYGDFGIQADIPAENWETYNRISFYLKADCAGIRHATVNLSFQNDGRIKIPDIYNREGFHNINLTCGEWTFLSLEIDTLPRDSITAFRFRSGMAGCETDPGLGNSLSFTVGDIHLQKTAETENTLGWALPKGKTAYCYSGYLPKMKKTAIAGIPAGSHFSIFNEKNEKIFSGISTESPGYSQVSVLDFSPVEQAGEYHIWTDYEDTAPFPISSQVYSSSIWKTINFLFCQRCGYPVPGSHQSCHRDITAHHDGRSFIFCGGWHDAGDLSQQLVQTAEITYSLFEAAAAYATDTALSLRLREEALWGLDYILHSRFGDGWRATSVGISMWTGNFLGDKDDLHARCHNSAYENFLCAGVEVFCSMQLRETDPLLAARVLSCAQADFKFAWERFNITGFTERPPEYWEHTWMTSPSLFAATISWAATQLYIATQDKTYAQKAAKYGDYLVSCQACVQAGCAQFPAWGFFYRSSGKKSLQHFNHQARDQYYMMALIGLCETQPEHPSFRSWSQSVQLYGDYLKALMEHGNPFGMMPSGLYRLEEINDTEAFSRQHLETGEEVKADYLQQLHNATSLGDGFYLKQFPVWFSFRGNNAVILSMGKSASMCGQFLKDRSLLNIAVNQLEWNIGKNPFRQSLMYGEGYRYAQQYATMPGEITGELPVGVQTLGNGDEPYWPQMNNATYKEVWTTPSARWLSIAADIAKMES